MKTVESLSLRKLVLVPAAVFLWSCSGTPNATGNDAANDGTGSNIAALDDVTGELARPADSSASAQNQDPRPVDQERRDANIKDMLTRARRSMELRDYADVQRITGDVLVLDPSNVEARNMLRAAGEMLGTEGAKAHDFVTRMQIAQERTEFRARQDMQLGDALLNQGKIGDAIERYQRAQLVLKFGPMAGSNSDLRSEIERRINVAYERQAAAMEDAEAAAIAASQRDSDEAERRRRLARDERLRTLLESANFEFQMGRFKNATTTLDTALRIDPNNDNALALADLARRALHSNRVEVLNQQWKAEWSKTFDDLRHDNIPQVRPIVFDRERWAEVAIRQPITFTPPEDLDSPEERAIRQRLEETRVAHRFASATIQDWARHYQSITEVVFFISPEIADGDETTLEDFNLPETSVARALNIICQQSGIKWRVNNGLVELLSGEAQVGKTYLHPYGVRDLVLGVRNKRGPNLKLKVPGEEEPFFDDEEEPAPTVVDEGRLEGLITNNIAPDSWDEVGVLRYQDGVLFVRHTKEVHQKIAQLLADLRQAVGIQVDIEARFLKVEDSFLEDVGVDFRGLGNQASEGIAGRGLERNNRSNLRFDDFGRPETINSAVPGIIGSGAEPGVFFDDGGDGDLLGRTENLFDSALGGGEDGLQNGGGLSLQAAFLDDIELEVVLRAVEKQQRSEEVVAPRLLVYNNTRAHMSALRHTSYIRDFEVEIAQAAAVANPIVDVVRDGVVLDVRPVVSADRRFITMELRPSVMTLQLPIQTFSTTLGAGQPVNIQLPEVTLQSVRTTVTVPDGSTLMLGGMRLSERQRLRSGVPFLQDLPGLSFLFSRRGNYVLNRKLLILIRASIILTEEHMPLQTSDEFDATLLSAMPR